MNQHQTRALNILLVEDNHGDIVFTKRMSKFSPIPTHFSVATDGEMAIAMLKKEKGYEDTPTPDVVLLDINLPKLTGPEVLSTMKSDPELSRIPVIMLSSSEAESEILQSIYLDAAGYIVKPINLIDFNDVIEDFQGLTGDHAVGRTPEEIIRAAQVENEEKQTMSDILRSLKPNSRSAESTQFNSGLLVKAIVEDFSETIAKKEAQFEFGQLPTLYSSPVRLSRVFHNLFDNALKFHDPAVPPKIFVSCDEDEDNWTFAVKDNGIGIPIDQLDNIFLFFKRLNHKFQFSGSGLGLSVSKKIVRGLGGKIWAESDGHTGSTFFFSLPKFH